MYYSIVRFLVPLLLAMLIAGVWTGFFVLLARYRPRLTVPGDLLLVFLTSFLVGWPGFVIFAPLTLLFAVVLSVRHQFVTLGLPSLLAAAAVLLFGGWLNSVLHLKVLAL